MPELPEVETIVLDLCKSIKGAIVIAAEVRNHSTIATPTPQEFTSTIIGKQILGISRRGKYLIFTLSDNLSLVVHLRMSGRFSFKDAHVSPLKHEHVTLILDDGRALCYHDTRKFGRWYLIPNTKELFSKLGAEPLSPDFNLDDFAKNIKSKARQLKPLLLDQAFIAGLGNIYVDEALFMAKLHPQTISSSLSQKEISALFKAIQTVLQRGIDSQGTSLGSGKANYYRLDGKPGGHQRVLSVFRQTGKPCLNCKTPIERLKVGQRSTHICPNCQRKN